MRALTESEFDIFFKIVAEIEKIAMYQSAMVEHQTRATRKLKILTHTFRREWAKNNSGKIETKKEADKHVFKS